jgi:hypothetical protein
VGTPEINGQGLHTSGYLREDVALWRVACSLLAATSRPLTISPPTPAASEQTARLKRLLAEAELEKDALREVAKGKF